MTAHNHAGSSTRIYQFSTLDSLGLVAGQGGSLTTILAGLGARATLSILVSVLCLVLASLGVCFCIRKSEFSESAELTDDTIFILTRFSTNFGGNFVYSQTEFNRESRKWK